MWQMIVKAGVSGLEGYINSQLTNANIDAQNTVGRANAAAANQVRSATNRFSSARAGFERWQQGENNKRILDGAGEAIAANVQNFIRDDKVRTAANFEQSIRDAEQMGAQDAAAAASGLTGSIVDTVNVTTALRRSRVNEAVRQMGEFARYDAGKRTGAILQAGIRGMNSSMIFDNIDYGNNVYSDKAKVNRWHQAAVAAGWSVLGDKGGLNVGDQQQNYSGRGVNNLYQFGGGRENQYGFSMYQNSGGFETANMAYDSTGSFMSGVDYSQASSMASSFSFSY